MRNLRLVLMLFSILVLISSVVHAAEDVKLEYTLYDQESSQRIKNTILRMDLHDLDNNKKISFNNYIQDKFSITLKPSKYEIILTVDDHDTEGKDYYYAEEIEINEDTFRDVRMFAIGSLNGVVYDNLDNLVKDVNVKLTCNKDYVKLPEAITDKFGSFSFNAVPVGKCKVLASLGDKLGKTDAEINKGDLADVKIVMSESIVGKSKANMFYFIVLSLIILGVLYYLFRKTKYFAGIKIAEKSERINDIMRTLNEKERQIINHLLGDKNISKQSDLVYHLKIPKTSMSRILESLERKNIINVEKIGKQKKVKLTDWFLKGKN